MEDPLTTLTAWLRSSGPGEVAAVTYPNARSYKAIRDAVDRAEFEAVEVSMRGTDGVDLVSAAKTPIGVTFRRKVIVVFEYDAIVAGDASLLSLVKQAIAVGKTPVMLVGASFRSKGAEIAKDMVPFRFDATSDYDVRAVFRDSPDCVDDKGLGGALAALSGQRRDFRGDNIAYGAIFDNYPRNMDLEACVAVACAFSDEDVVTEGMRRAGCFDDIYTFVPIEATASVARATMPKIDTFGKLWSQANAMAAKAKSARTLRFKPHDGLDYLRLVFGTCAASGKFEDAAAIARALKYDPADVLAVMRLWKTKYTLSTHAKLKKAF